MKKTNLDHWDKRHMEEILSDQTLLSALLMDGEVARRIEIDPNGNITIGRFKSKFINWLFRDQRHISFVEFAYKVSNALSGQKNNRNEVIFDGIADIIKNMHRNNHVKEADVKYVVDALFDTMRLGWNGDRKSSYITAEKDYSPRQKKQQMDCEVSFGKVMLNSGEQYGPMITILKQK